MTSEEILEWFKTATDFAHDYENICACVRLLQTYDRENACELGTRLINEYADEINLFGFLVDGRKVDYSKQFNSLLDNELKWQLQYLQLHMPIYALMKKGEEKLARQLVEFINGDEK